MKKTYYVLYYKVCSHSLGGSVTTKVKGVTEDLLTAVEWAEKDYEYSYETFEETT